MKSTKLVKTNKKLLKAKKKPHLGSIIKIASISSAEVQATVTATDTCPDLSTITTACSTIITMYGCTC